MALNLSFWIASVSTFHSVYISTLMKMHLKNLCINLHSTLFILVRRFFRNLLENHKNLHSTLFILVQVNRKDVSYRQINLHSTLFILVRGTAETIDLMIRSTFHSVYISTHPTNPAHQDQDHLHSTLFILVPQWFSLHVCFQRLYIPLCLY